MCVFFCAFQGIVHLRWATAKMLIPKLTSKFVTEILSLVSWQMCGPTFSTTSKHSTLEVVGKVSENIGDSHDRVKISANTAQATDFVQKKSGGILPRSLFFFFKRVKRRKTPLCYPNGNENIDSSDSERTRDEIWNNISFSYQRCQK